MTLECRTTSPQRKQNTHPLGRPLSILFSSILAAMAALPSAYAQPTQAGPDQSDKATPASSGSPTTLEAITVVGTHETDPADEPYRTAGSAAYISGEQIERFRGTSVGDFLSGIPGVLNGDSRNSGAVDVNIRGMQGQGRVPVIVDGATQETTIWQGYNGATPRSYIDPDFISSVAIEKGISSAADATGATGGVVRTSTLKVEDVLLPDRRFGIRLKGGFVTNSSRVPAAGTNGGWDSLSTDLSEFGGTLPADDVIFYSEGMRRPPLFKPTGGSGSVVVAATTDYVDLVAGYVRRKNGNYHAGANGSDSAHAIAVESGSGRWEVGNGGLSAYRAGEEVLNTSLDNTSWMVKTIFKPGPDHKLELGYRKYLSDFGHLLSSRLFGSPYQSWLSNIDLDTYIARYHWKPEHNDFIDLKIDSYLSVMDNRINALDMITAWESNSYSRRPTIKLMFPFFQWVETKRAGVTVANTSRFSTPVGDLRWQYGGALVNESSGLPRGVDGEEYLELGGEPPRDGHRKEISGFTELEWKPVQKVTASASTRYSHFRTVDNGYVAKPGFERKDGGWSSLFKLTVEPKDGLQLYTKYGKAVRAPSIFESLSGASFYFPVEQNSLKLERARNLEMGVNFVKDNAWRDGDRLRIHGAYFYNHIDDYLTRAGVRRLLPGIRQPGFIEVETLGRINLDYAEMRGLEISARYDTGRYYGSLAWNHYTRMMFCARKGSLLSREPTCLAGGLPHSYTLQQVPPRDTLTLELGARLLQNQLQLGTRVNYIGSRFAPGFGRSIGMSGVEPSRWSPYTLVDAYASYQFNKNTSFDVAIDNLTDRYYMDALNAAQMPAPGRTIRGSVTVKF